MGPTNKPPSLFYFYFNYKNLCLCDEITHNFFSTGASISIDSNLYTPKMVRYTESFMPFS